MEETATYLNLALDFALKYGPGFLVALALLVGGLWAIKRISQAFEGFLRARKVDESLRPFFTSLVDVGMKVVLLLMVAGRLGIETTSFIAVFSAVAFAVGLALQGSLGNFASGVLILLFRPYKVGDHVKVGDKAGTVTEIQIFNTILTTPQNIKIIFPNGEITKGSIENITETGEVRADIFVNVKDTTSINLLRAVADEVVRKCPNALEGRAPFVQIAGFPQDGMKVEIGCWTTGKHYFETQYYLYEELKKGFDAVGIEMAKEDEKQ